MGNCCLRCCRSTITWIVVASFGVAAGGLAAPMFATEFKNYNATAFALISALIAAFVIVLHVKHKRNTLIRWLKFLPYVMLFGCLGQLLGIVALVTYISLGAVLGQSLSQTHGENFFVAAVWGWMTWKWSFSTFWFARKYKHTYDQYLILKNDIKEVIVDYSNPPSVIVDHQSLATENGGGTF